MVMPKYGPSGRRSWTVEGKRWIVDAFFRSPPEYRDWVLGIYDVPRGYILKWCRLLNLDPLTGEKKMPVPESGSTRRAKPVVRRRSVVNRPSGVAPTDNRPYRGPGLRRPDPKRRRSEGGTSFMI